MVKKIDLERANEILRENYEECENLSFVNDRVAYALYYTWRKVDETNRLGRVNLEGRSNGKITDALAARI